MYQNCQEVSWLETDPRWLHVHRVMFHSGDNSLSLNGWNFPKRHEGTTGSDILFRQLLVDTVLVQVLVDTVLVQLLVDTVLVCLPSDKDPVVSIPSFSQVGCAPSLASFSGTLPELQFLGRTWLETAATVSRWCHCPGIRPFLVQSLFMLPHRWYWVWSLRVSSLHWAF